jgi:hypothetical protein
MYVGHAMHTCLYTNLDPIVVILTYYLVPKARLLRPNLRVMINDYVIITLTCDLFNTTMTIGRGSSSSKRLRYVHSSNTKKGRVTVENTLNKKGVRDFQAKSRAQLQSKVAGESCLFITVFITYPSTAMNEEERMAYDAARDIPEDEDDGYVTEDEPMNIMDILDGTAELNLSHAGGEFQHIVEDELYQQRS